MPAKKPTPPPASPLDDARAAFDPLSTPDKTAFVLEATFETLGQALSETGRSISTAIHALDLDLWFRAPGEPTPPPAAPPPPPAAPTTPPAVPPRPKAA